MMMKTLSFKVRNKMSDSGLWRLNLTMKLKNSDKYNNPSL